MYIEEKIVPVCLLHERTNYNRRVLLNMPVITGALVNAPVIVSALNHFYQYAPVIVSALKALCNFYQY